MKSAQLCPDLRAVGDAFAVRSVEYTDQHRRPGVTETARQLIAGKPASTVVRDHRIRLERLFATLRDGAGPES